MKAFSCRICESALFFENFVCLSCQARLGFSRDDRAIVPVDSAGRYVDARGFVWWLCSNRSLSGCTWLADVKGGQCFACSLTRTRPNDADTVGLVGLAEAERAKRHLIVELDSLGYSVVSKRADAENGLAFDMLFRADGRVVTGHEEGVITIDVSESDPAHREKVRVKLDEPYRTMLGHFRHEVGHYIEWQLVRGSLLIEECRRIFGDERASYEEAIKRHYENGPPANWQSSYISTYATMHPYEDFAESFAHFLHIRDTIDTAVEQGLVMLNPRGFSSFRDLVTAAWLPLSTALNQINRSMGRDDLYPFVIPPLVLEKLDFVSILVDRLAPRRTPLSRNATETFAP